MGDIVVEPDCLACGDTGISYWSDGVDGFCLNCKKGDEVKKMEEMKYCDYCHKERNFEFLTLSKKKTIKYLKKKNNCICMR